MHENGIGHGVCTSISYKSSHQQPPKTESQDIHPHNILFNHDNCRAVELRYNGDSDTPIVPFHSTFDFRMAFIDFECAAHFGRGVSPLVRPGNIPPSDIAAPEQANLDGGEYDLFKADVFNLGRTLMKEMQRASAVSFIP
jgi:serine/threonine protein kinase